jgi:hypothetical protein
VAAGSGISALRPEVAFGDAEGAGDAGAAAAPESQRPTVLASTCAGELVDPQPGVCDRLSEPVVGHPTFFFSETVHVQAEV